MPPIVREPRTAEAPSATVICPYCRAPLGGHERTRTCSSCRTAHHLECWELSGGCTVHGCRSIRSLSNDGTPAAPITRTPGHDGAEGVHGDPLQRDDPSRDTSWWARYRRRSREASAAGRHLPGPLYLAILILLAPTLALIALPGLGRSTTDLLLILSFFGVPISVALLPVALRRAARRRG